MDEEKELTHIDLFSGIGGFTLAGEWAGFRTIVFCEKEEFCQKVLQKRFGAVIADPKGRRCVSQNKKTQTGGNATKRCPQRIPIIPEIRDFDGAKFRGATLLTGGFPCQPFSVAGPRTGTKDDRHLWPEMLRIIKEAKPRWVLAENVTGIVKLALGEVLSDLEGIGYDFPRDHEGTPIVPVIPACSLNAPHRRYRVWIIAYTENPHGWSLSNKEANGRWAKEIGRPNSHAPDPQCLGWQEGTGKRTEHEKQVPKGQDTGNGDSKGIASDSEKWKPGKSKTGNGRQGFKRGDWQEDWYEVAANLLRVDDGLPGWFYLYREGINNATAIKNLSRQDLQVLSKIFQQKEISERMGRLWEIPQEGALLPILCEFEIRANKSNYISSQGENLSGGFLRSVWDEGKSRSASYKWRHSTEHKRKHNDALPSVPYEIALDIKEAWDCVSYLQDAIRSDRVKRLKALGNAIVPQIVYEILRYIAWIENERATD